MKMAPNFNIEQIDDRLVEWRGKALLYFGGCDYLRLSRHPEILSALQSASQRRGNLSTGASRTTTGNHDVFESLEKQLATFLGSESVALTGAGYLANLTLASYFGKKANHLIIDAAAHSSLRDAATLSGCQTHYFQHRNHQAASDLLTALGSPERCILLTDGVFGLNGTVAELDKFHSTLPENVAFIIDDAHGFGVMGKKGKGTGSDIPWGKRPIIRTISLAKTLGCHGGAIAGSEQVIHEIKTQSPVWSGHTPFPVSLGEACSTSLSILSQDSRRRQLLEQNVVFLRSQLEKSTVLPSLDVRFPVLSFVCDHMKSPEQRAQVEAIFVQHGVYPSIIRYAGSTERLMLRLALSSGHPPEDIQILMTVLESVHKAFGIQPFLMSDIQ